MKKLVCITGIILISCTLIGTFASASSFAEIENASKMQTASYDETEQIYVLKICNGSLAVYKKGENTPFMTTDTRSSNLPKGDVAALEKGIEVTGAARLKRALEDYCS